MTEWPSQWDPGPKEHLHAIGVLCLGWNWVEIQFRRVLACYMDLPAQQLASQWENLGNQTATDLLRIYSETAENDRYVKDALLNAVKALNICRENRNIIIHSDARMTINETVFQVAKKANRKDQENLYNLSLQDLRRVATDIRNLSNWLAEAANYLERRDELMGVYRDAANLPDTLGAFPGKFALPSKLSPLPR